MENKKVELSSIFAPIAFALVLVTCTGFNVLVLLVLTAMFTVAFFRKEESTSLIPLLEAIYLEILIGISMLVIIFFETVIGKIIDWAGGNRFGAFADVFSVIYFLLAAAFGIIALISLLKSLKGGATRTLIVSDIAAKSLGIFVPKPVYNQYAQQPYPSQQAWVCECGHASTGAFCPNCGKSRAK